MESFIFLCSDIWDICLSRPYSFKFLKGCLPQILLSPLLNTLSHIFMLNSFFLQTITQATENQYQASKKMFKVSNKITRKKYASSHLKNSYHMQTSITFANQLTGFYMIQVFTERYFQTDINLTYNLSFLIFLKFRNNYFQETSVTGSEGVSFVPS